MVAALLEHQQHGILQKPAEEWAEGEGPGHLWLLRTLRGRQVLRGLSAAPALLRDNVMAHVSLASLFIIIGYYTRIPRGQLATWHTYTGVLANIPTCPLV
jgi:hypothetical protein